MQPNGYVELKSPARGLKSTLAAVIAASEAHPLDSQPQKPQRQGSLVFRVRSQQKSLTHKQLSESGLSLDLSTANKSDTPVFGN
jgi:hypothetical protein